MIAQIQITGENWAEFKNHANDWTVGSVDQQKHTSPTNFMRGIQSTKCLRSAIFLLIYYSVQPADWYTILHSKIYIIANKLANKS